MQATRDEVLKVHQDQLLKKDTGINRMLERTQGANAEAAREGKEISGPHALFFSCLFSQIYRGYIAYIRK